MDDTPQALPDEATEDTEFAGLDEADWIADIDRYYQDNRPPERQPHEFTTMDWRDLWSERRGVQVHRNQAAAELDRLVQSGKATRRRGIVSGKWVWLYSFRK